MNPQPTTNTQKNRGPALLLSLGLAGLLVFITYMIYGDAAREDEIASSNPPVLMKVTGRARGWGTVKYPDHIYAQYQGKQYDFSCGRKYFNKTMEADSIVAHLDVTSGAAALPGSGRVRHLLFLFALILGVALLTIYNGVRTFVKST
ncbi:hypothetical protein IC229_34655 [Spirosoma sp. BT702]|uniref:Uncharacterized protein n=1 Tax=Spirosoma profusum TaxID=2771354 RepID=A0A927AWQ2_9BACT|nr:hypothetical protein [Spirosoma profusum]MBD2705792.1 hypothetical protein [Spirosoma profusum]